MSSVDAGNHVRTPGLPVLSHTRLWHPATVRWVAIAPAGTVEVHTSDNQVGFEADEGLWLQWQMVLDIGAVLDPTASCVDHRMVLHEVTDDVDGMVLEPCLRHESGLAYRPNPVATDLIARLQGRTGNPRQVYGTVVWLGYADDNGIHASITDDRVKTLRELSRATLNFPNPYPPAKDQPNRGTRA